MAATSNFWIGGHTTELMPASQVKAPKVPRIMLNTPILNELFGNGVKPGMVATIAALPGIGKTTLLMQIAEEFERTGRSSAFISGEENVEQLKDLCDRLGVEKTHIAHDTDLDSICQSIEEYDFVVIDSLQAVTITGQTKNIEKIVANQIVAFAKEFSTIVIIVTHATKAGAEKGNSAITHIADMRMVIRNGNYESFYIENPKIVMVLKNRFGKTGSAVFSMGDQGYDLNNPFLWYLHRVSRQDILKE